MSRGSGITPLPLIVSLQLNVTALIGRYPGSQKPWDTYISEQEGILAVGRQGLPAALKGRYFSICVKTLFPHTGVVFPAKCYSPYSRNSFPNASVTTLLQQGRFPQQGCYSSLLPCSREVLQLCSGSRECNNSAPPKESFPSQSVTAPLHSSESRYSSISFSRKSLQQTLLKRFIGREESWNLPGWKKTAPN